MDTKSAPLNFSLTVVIDVVHPLGPSQLDPSHSKIWMAKKQMTTRPIAKLEMRSWDYDRENALEHHFRNRNSRPIFTRFTPLYSMMSAVA